MRLGTAVVSVAVNSSLFLLAFRVLTARRVRPRDLLPGAVAAAVAWQGLQLGGTYYLSHLLGNASATYGVFGIVLGLVPGPGSAP